MNSAAGSFGWVSCALPDDEGSDFLPDQQPIRPEASDGGRDHSWVEDARQGHQRTWTEDSGQRHNHIWVEDFEKGYRHSRVEDSRKGRKHSWADESDEISEIDLDWPEPYGPRKKRARTVAPPASTPVPNPTPVNTHELAAEFATSTVHSSSPAPAAPTSAPAAATPPLVALTPEVVTKPSTLSIASLAEGIPFFSGLGNDAAEFIQAVEFSIIMQMPEHTPFWQERAKRIVFHNRLNGEAADWYTLCLRDSEIKSDWAQLKTAFLERFEGPLDNHDFYLLVVSKFVDFKQGETESIAQYIKRADQLADILPSWLLRKFGQKLARGLNDAFAELVHLGVHFTSGVESRLSYSECRLALMKQLSF